MSRQAGQNSSGHFQSIWHAILLSTTVLSLTIGSPTRAEPIVGGRVAFNIPAQELDSALVAFAEQSKMQIVVQAAVLRGLKTSGVAGDYSTNEALNSLLNKSGLQYRFTGANTIAVVQTAQAAEPAPIKEEAKSAPPAVQLEEVIVTAEKRSTSLQKTPISISVLGTNELKQLGVNGMTDLGSGSVPSLRLLSFAGRASAVTIGMRGIVPLDATQVSRDPAIGIYMDDVYLGRVQGLGSQLYDVERVEVLKGPQGTLFGRNTVGGALSFITKKPTGRFGVEQTLSVGNFGEFKAITHLNLPKMANISLKIDAVYAKRGGTINNTAVGQADWNQYDRKGIRVAALWEPTDNFSALYAGEVSRDESTGGYSQIVALFPGAPPLAPLQTVQTGRINTGAVGVLLQPSVGLVQGHSLTLTWEPMTDLQIKSISSYRRIKQSQYDNSGANFSAFRPNGFLSRYSLAFVQQKQFSQELQAVGSLPRLKYVAGLYYFWERGADSAYAPSTAQWNADGTAQTIIPSYVPRPFPDRAANAHAKSLAAYGQATYTPPLLNDDLHLTAGLRYTSDRKNGALTALSGVTKNIPFTFGSDRVDPAVTVAYDISDNLNAYVRWGTAYRAGGADERSLTFRAFGPETVNSWEIGAKSTFWENRARLNVAAYHTTYKDLQIAFTNPANVASTETLNTKQPAKIKGLEADFSVSPIEKLTVTAGYAFTQWKLPPQISPFNGVATPTAILFTPKHAASIAVDYTIPAGNFAQLGFHLDASAQSSFFSATAAAPRLPGYALLNGRVTLRNIEFGARAGSLELAFWMKNITNKAYIYYDFPLAGAGLINGIFGDINEPRTFGLDATYRF